MGKLQGRPFKLELAKKLREQTLVTMTWIAERLQTGTRDHVITYSIGNSVGKPMHNDGATVTSKKPTIPLTDPVLGDAYHNVKLAPFTNTAPEPMGGGASQRWTNENAAPTPPVK